MNTHHRIALLIDADNVSIDVLRQILHRLNLTGDRLQHRRAYGSVQKAAEFAEICRDHAIRFLPSTFAGPNATDIAMAIDAIELVLRQPVDEVVIVSSDMDYSPLIVRLRELGCRVTGYGQAGKSGRDIERDYERVYDSFEVVGPSKARPAGRVPVRASDRRRPADAASAVAPAASAEASAPARGRAPRARSAVPAPVTVPVAASMEVEPAVVAEPDSARRAPSRRRSAAKAAPKAAPVVAVELPALPPAVDAVLEACPELRGGAPVRLNGVAVALRERGLLTKSGKTTSFFKKLDAHFVLLPADKPESVRFLGGGAEVAG